MTIGKALYGSILAGDLAVRTPLESEKGALGASWLRDGRLAGARGGRRARPGGDGLRQQRPDDDASARSPTPAAALPILTQLAAAPAAIPTAAAPRPTTAQDIATAVQAAASAAADLAAVQSADTVPALQAAIPGALSTLQVDAAGFGVLAPLSPCEWGPRPPVPDATRAAGASSLARVCARSQAMLEVGPELDD